MLIPAQARVKTFNIIGTDKYILNVLIIYQYLFKILARYFFNVKLIVYYNDFFLQLSLILLTIKNILFENYQEFANRFLNMGTEVETRLPCKVWEHNSCG